MSDMRSNGPGSPVLMTLAMALLATTLAACGSAKSKSSSNDQPLTATFAPVEMRTMDSGLSASGLLVPREEAAVSTQLDGYRVAEVLVDQGAEVAAGQPLARLDDTLLKAQLEQAEAAVANQEANFERAEAEARRVDGLDGQGVISQEQIDERRLAAREQHLRFEHETIAHDADARPRAQNLAQSSEKVRAVAGELLHLLRQRHIEPGAEIGDARLTFLVALFGGRQRLLDRGELAPQG